jgi:hypothetical protein
MEKRCTILLSPEVTEAMDIAFAIGFQKQEKEKVKTKPQQIAYALELLAKLHKQNKIDNVLLIGLK